MSRGRSTARRLLHSVLSAEWAILPQWLAQFATLADRIGEDGGSGLNAQEIRLEIRRGLAALNEERPEHAAISLDLGEPLAEGSRATVRDGVAIVPVLGPLFHYADAFHDVCGCSSYAQIATDVAAIRDAGSHIRATLFEIDSPGGEVAGVAETAELIAELAAAMPLAGYVSDLGASAAYWLSAAMGEVVVARTALLGSIGVVASFRKSDGNRTIEIVSSQSPKKRPDIATESGRAQIQATVDALAEVFVEAVAGFRGVSVDTVLSDFGQGDVLVGQRAVDAGLADRLGSFEGLLAELQQRTAKSAFQVAGAAGGDQPSREGHMPDNPTTAPAADAKPAEAATTTPLVTRAYLDEKHPDLVAAIRDEGAAAENERVHAIEAIALAGHEELVAEMKKDRSVSADAAARKILEAEKSAGSRRLADLAADEEELEAPKAGSTSDATGKGAASKEETQANEILTAGRPQQKRS